MANISHISPQVDVENQQIFNKLPICSYKETFDPFLISNVQKSPKKGSKVSPNTEDDSKSLINKRRRKIISDDIAQEIIKYEQQLPEHERGKWNYKTSFIHTPTYHRGGEIISDDEIEEYRQYLLNLGYDENDIEQQFIDEGIELIKNRFGFPILKRTDIEADFNERNYNLHNHIGNQKVWTRILNCNSDIIQVKDQKTNKDVHVIKQKCNHKLCLNCSQSRSRIAITKYRKAVNNMNEPVMVVLHMESPKKGSLKSHIDFMYKCWRHILRKQIKSDEDSFNGICALEVTTSEKNQTYHPHYHIIIEKSQAEKLVLSWINEVAKRTAPVITEYKRITRGKRKNQVIEKSVMDENVFNEIKKKMIYAHTHEHTLKLFSELPREDDGKVKIKELFKYAMKMSVTNKEVNSKRKTRSSIEMIYEIAKSLQGVQQWRPFGEFRNTPDNTEVAKMISQEMETHYKEHPHLKESKHWRWNGDDWEGEIALGVNMKLIGTPVDKETIGFQRLNNNFVNERIHEPSNEFEQPGGLQIFETPGQDKTVQEIPGRETTQRSIHHIKQPPS